MFNSENLLEFIIYMLLFVGSINSYFYYLFVVENPTKIGNRFWIMLIILCYIIGITLALYDYNAIN